MRFFRNKQELNKNEERNPYDDEEDLNSLLEMKDLFNSDIQEIENSSSGDERDGEKNIEPPGQISEIITDDTDKIKISELSRDELSEDSGDNDIFDQKIAIKLKLAIVWNNKGIALTRSGKYPEAIEAYDQALLIDPNYISAWNNKGVVLSKLGKYPEAIEAYDKALISVPNHFTPQESQVKYHLSMS
jgi:tetratricopeptide (TPR) repeat protein